MFGFLKKKEKHSEAEFMLKANEELLKRKLAGGSNSSDLKNSNIDTNETNNVNNFAVSSLSSKLSGSKETSNPPSQERYASSVMHSSQQDSLSSLSQATVDDLSAYPGSAKSFKKVDAPKDVDYFNLGNDRDNFSISNDLNNFSESQEKPVSQHSAGSDVLNEILEELRMLRSQNDYILSILKRLEKKMG